MKGLIDINGSLYIKRGNQMARQFCPHADETPCGDWCPLFGEISESSSEYFLLGHCHQKGYIAFREIEDRRG